jgi:hypothetical protein
LLAACVIPLALACAPVEQPGGAGGAGGNNSGSGGATGGSRGGSGGSGQTGSGGSGQTGTGGSGGSQTGSGGSGQTGTGGSGGSQTGSGGSGQAGTGGSGGGGASGGAGGSAGGSGGSGGRADGGAEVGGSGGGGSGGAGGMGTGGAGGAGGGSNEKFSFFYTSLDAMRRLSKSQNGFGGDLRFGTASGLEGADKICQTIAGDVGFGNKTWRAFLSVVRGPDGMPVHAIDRVGQGPWYDRRGRLIAMNRAGLLAGNRPAGDAAAVADLPDETGQGTRRLGDTHDVITGSNTMGQLRSPVLANTCQDWTSAMGTGTIGFGHAWPAGSGMHWIQVHTGRNCAAGVNLVQNGGGNGQSIGAGGGWGGIYCFALQP